MAHQVIGAGGNIILLHWFELLGNPEYRAIILGHREARELSNLLLLAADDLEKAVAAGENVPSRTYELVASGGHVEA